MGVGLLNDGKIVLSRPILLKNLSNFPAAGLHLVVGMVIKNLARTTCSDCAQYSGSTTSKITVYLAFC